MTKYRDFTDFIKRNSNHYKKFKISIPIFDDDYEFDIKIITSEYLKLQHEFTYDELFSSPESSIEHILESLIDDGRSLISDSNLLSKRAGIRRDLRGTVFMVPVLAFTEDFKINAISQRKLSIEKIVNFDDFNKSSDYSLVGIVKNQLYNLRENIDADIQMDQEKYFKKQEKKLTKLNELDDSKTTYNEGLLKFKAMRKKNILKKVRIPLKLNDSYSALDINGVGDYAVKLGRIFDVEDIYYARDGSFEKMIKDEIDFTLKGTYSDIVEFKNSINKNFLKLNNKIYFKIYGKDCFF